MDFAFASPFAYVVGDSLKKWILTMFVRENSKDTHAYGACMTVQSSEYPVSHTVTTSSLLAQHTVVCPDPYDMVRDDLYGFIGVR